MHHDITHVDVHSNIELGDVHLEELQSLLMETIKEIIDQHEKKELRPSLHLIYSKLKDLFEGTHVESHSELPTTTPNVAKKHETLVNASHEETPVTSGVTQNTTSVSKTYDETGSARSNRNGSKDVSTAIKRQILVQDWYRSTERNVK